MITDTFCTCLTRQSGFEEESSGDDFEDGSIFKRRKSAGADGTRGNSGQRVQAKATLKYVIIPSAVGTHDI